MRIQVEFDEHGISQIEELKQKTGVSTYKELFNNALAILSWAVRQRETGRKIASIDEERNEFRELEVPALEHAAQFSTAAASRRTVSRKLA